MSIWKDYITEVYNNLRYWAVWAPATHLELGDCGPVRDMIFRRERNVP